MSSSTQRKTGVILSYVSLIVTIVIQLLYTPVLVRTLGQSEYGIYSLVANIIGYLTLLDFGFGNAITVFTAKYRAKKQYEEEKKLHGTVAILFNIIGIITIFLGLVLYFNVQNIFGASMTVSEIQKMKIMMLILTFNLAITFSFSIYSSIITAYEKFIYQKVKAIIASIIKPLIMLPLLFLGFKSITMCVVITIINLFVLITNYIFCKRKLKIKIRYNGIDKKILKMVFGYSFFIFLNIIVDKANYSVDPVILGTLYGTSVVSIYSIASNLDQFFINISTAVSGVFLPKMAKLVVEKVDAKVLTNEFIKVGRIQYYIIFLICSGFILVGKTFINLWVGNVYNDAYYITLCLIIPACVPLIQNIGLSIMEAMNKHKFRALVTFIMSVFNIVISIFLAKKYGAIGAAIGTTISIVLCNCIIMNIYYYKVIKINVIEFWKNILKMTSYFLIPLGITLIIMYITKFNGVLNLLVYGFIYTILYILICYFVVFNDYEKDLVDDFLIKIKLKKKKNKD